MSETAAGLRRPSTTWEFAVSAADQLVLWSADGAPAVAGEPLRTRTVVLLAAAVYDQAREARLEDAEVASVPLARVYDALRQPASSLLEACPAPAGIGGEERDWLLAQYGTDAAGQVTQAAQDAVNRHLAAAGTNNDVTIADRRPALREAARRRQRETLAALEGDDY